MSQTRPTRLDLDHSGTDYLYAISYNNPVSFTQIISYEFSTPVTLGGFYIYTSSDGPSITVSLYIDSISTVFSSTGQAGYYSFSTPLSGSTVTLNIDYTSTRNVYASFVPIFKNDPNTTFVGVYNNSLTYNNQTGRTNSTPITPVIRVPVNNTSLYPSFLDTFYRDGTINKFSTQDPKSNVTITINTSVNSLNFNKFYIYSTNL
jgi:hypothetical protein